MAQGTNIQTLLGATLSVSANIPPTYDSAGYGGTTMTWTAVGNVESIGNYGGSANVVKFTPVDTGTINKSKGSVDYGALAVMLASVPADAGQVILNTAFGSKNHYSVKVTYPLRQGESTAEIHYMDVLVSKHEYQDGTVDNIMKLSVDLELSRAVVVVAAT